MIELTRLRTQAAIKSKYRGAEKIAKDLEVLRAYRDVLKGVTTKIEFDSKFWTAAKQQLKRETKGKCAYCEGNTEVVAHGDVEHYRPKSVYWWLAYTYDNYLYACQICNQKYKSDNFPTQPQLMMAPNVDVNSTDAELIQLAGKISPDPFDILQNFTLAQFEADHLLEDAHLINPYHDDPTKYFAYEADDVIEEVKVIAAQPQFAKNVKAAEDYYGINRLELKQFRYSVFDSFRYCKRSVRELPDGSLKNDAKKLIKKMLSDKFLFAGMNRYFDSRL